MFFSSEQKGRREVFDYIYDEIPDKDWQNPANAHLVEQRYVALAYDRWAGTEDAWMLDGDWMVSRPDILSWMRTIYWKHNKPRRLRRREGPLSNLPRCREGLLLTPFCRASRLPCLVPLPGIDGVGQRGYPGGGYSTRSSGYELGRWSARGVRVI